MSKRFAVTLGLLSLIALVGAGCSQGAPSTPTPSATAPVNSVTTISMTDSGFSPSDITVTKGTTVTFTNSGSQPHWPASAPHPTHTNYPEFDPKQGIAPGASWSFTFDKVGSWGFHDHLNASSYGYGKVVVTE